MKNKRRHLRVNRTFYLLKDCLWFASGLLPFLFNPWLVFWTPDVFPVFLKQNKKTLVRFHVERRGKIPNILLILPYFFHLNTSLNRT